MSAPATPQDAERAHRPTTPTLALPRGGGAIHGIGDKFAANPVTGTGSLTVPIATSPGRSGFGPELSLSYDSGSGNGPFGFGWSLSLPAISRRTHKRLPRYADAEESDVFLLSGAEDLVPEFRTDATGDWFMENGAPIPHEEERVVDGGTYRVRRYRPRIEGLFARIERWANVDDASDVHWRSLSSNNVLTLYGKDSGSRIADPADPRRIFTWLICETRDDRGNGIVYDYRADDGAGVDTAQAHERNRGGPDDPRRTANRYIKRIRYGNRAPLLDGAGRRPPLLSPASIQDAGWMFEVVFDYGEHDADAPSPQDSGDWAFRGDPFSTYRPGFEVRTTRLCRRVLMFHHFPGEEDVGGDCLVRSTDFTYSHEREPDQARDPVYTFLVAVTQHGYRRRDGGYLRRSMPPVEFGYSEPIVQDAVEEVDPDSLENLPVGLDGTTYRWADLHGEGVPGILSEQADTWFYKRNLSPLTARREDGGVRAEAMFAPVEVAALKPNHALARGAQLMDLAGDGQPDVVVLDGPVPGLHEHDGADGWSPFRPFTSRLNRNTRDPNLRFVDLDGDGRADALITEHDAFVWHASLAEHGFGAARRVAQALDEEEGPRLVFADGTESIHLADLSGDGLTDLVRIRNGEVSYWPNLGYARFGAKVTMDHAPRFDHPDRFDPKRVRLADIDGSGTSDIVYLHPDGVRLYFNQSGNGWSEPRVLSVSPRVDDLVAIEPVDLLGNGTACLVWSSPLPGDAGRSMRYVNLMGGQKPHLLVSVGNNLGAETRVHYAPSTRFYLESRRAGRPWITRLPFPVHVVERVEILDHISRNRFVTRYAYHHGYFDGEEREFRGFGMVEQWDTEEIGALTADGAPPATNADSASHVPPVRTRTWFHTGVYVDRQHVSRQYETEYFREPGLSNEESRALLLPDTILPAGLTAEEEREACRALKGMMLRQEVYADDAPPDAPEAVRQRAGRPYTVVERDFTVRRVQPRAGNRHAVFLAHPREAITYHYERRLAPVLNGVVVDEATAAADPNVDRLPDPRVRHALTLEVDGFGNVLKEAAVGYGRRRPDASLPLQADRDRQTRTLVTYTEHGVTNAIADAAAHPDDYRTPVRCESRTYELTGYTPTGAAGRFTPNDFVTPDPLDPAGKRRLHVFDGELAYEQQPSSGRQRRPIEHVRTLFRPDDLGVSRNDDPSALLPLGTVEPVGLEGEAYRLAFTPGLLAQVFDDNGQPLIPDPGSVLGGQGSGRGGYVASQELKAGGVFPAADPDDHWWIPAGRVFRSPESNDPASQELDYARGHFFLPHRFRDPFAAESFVAYDAYDLLLTETRDALGNRVTVGARTPADEIDPGEPGNDYRVLQPRLVTDVNRNRSEVAFDALGLVVGTAVMGKLEETVGDSLAGFEPDLSRAQVDGLFDADDPHVPAGDLLGDAATRIVYDLDRFRSTRQAYPDDPTRWLPAFTTTLARETHASDPLPPGGLKIQIGFSYSDGFGREIQKKVQAEPGPLVDGGPVVGPRWVGSGWTIFNNKGKPVRQYEPFFSRLAERRHRFEFGVEAGVSPILFYDPVGRVVATLHPDHGYEKVVFDPWRQTTWDANDTVLGDPRTDPDSRGHTAGYFASLAEQSNAPPWQTWYEQRQGGALGAREQAAAEKASAHAGTPATAYLDTLGRPVLTTAHNRVVCPGHKLDGTEEWLHTRVELDIEGNERAVRDTIVQDGDAGGRIVARYDYDMLGNRIHQASMEAGERWLLNDVLGKPIRSWDSRGHAFRTEYDPLRRPARAYVAGADPDDPQKELLTDRQVYGEQHPDAAARNLRGRLYLHLDQAGAAASEDVDFKGNTVRASRRIALEYRKAVDWRSVDEDHVALPVDATSPVGPGALDAALAPLLEAETYTGLTTYDALGRPATLTTPHTPMMQPSVIRPGYNEANLLERVDANLRGETVAGEPVWTPFVTNIEYDAKGRRTRIDYGNGARTFYEYDPLTHRLVRLLTRRDAAAFPADCPAQPVPGWPGCDVQDLHYTYDPSGNITHTQDDAQQTIYFRNKRVEPRADYTYDALYRLIEATGREHLGQTNGSPNPPAPHSHDDAPRVRLAHPGDGQAMGNYVERYVYDAVGNFLEMQHRGTDPAHPGWTRGYEYDEPSQVEPAKRSNRLTRTTVGSTTETYSSAGDGYDAHGSMLRMPHLPLMRWDHRDQLQATSRQVVTSGGTPETTYYTYDAAGERVRKVTELSTGQVKDERIYLGGFEVYRRHGLDPLERETLHIMDDEQRVALVESRTHGSEPDVPPRVIRYQLGDRLGSSSIELDEDAALISYEEYHPYGTTSYQAGRTAAEVSLKRYRFTAKERDGESGLYYHGARYYAAWLGRWTSADPSELIDGVNLFAYARGAPCMFVDPDGTDGRRLTPDQIKRLKEKDKRTARVRRRLKARKGRGGLQSFYLPKPKGSSGKKHGHGGQGTTAQGGKPPGTPASGGAGSDPSSGSTQPTNPEESKGTSTILDDATALLGLLNFEDMYSDNENAVASGGMPGGHGPKENASPWGTAFAGLLFAWGVVGTEIKEGLQVGKTALVEVIDIARRVTRHVPLPLRRSFRYVKHASGLETFIESGTSERLHEVVAKLDASFLGKGTEPTKSARKYIKVVGDEVDDAGHAIASRLGGSGGATMDNLFPQLSAVNRGEFRVWEAEIAGWVKAGDDVSIKLTFQYADEAASKPIGVVYTAYRNGVEITRIFKN